MAGIETGAEDGAVLQANYRQSGTKAGACRCREPHSPQASTLIHLSVQRHCGNYHLDDKVPVLLPPCQVMGKARAMDCSRSRRRSSTASSPTENRTRVPGAKWGAGRLRMRANS